jgi:hypothetical protein
MSIRQLDEILAQRKHVMEFDRTAEPPSKELVDSLLRRAWKVTPSKNNFMPYTINVLGPEYQDEKDHLYRKSLASETSANKNNPIPDSHDQLNMPAYACIASCAYLLVFTDRWEDQPNPYQKMCWDKLGVFHAPMTKEGVRSIGETVSLEVGMFATAFAGLCVDNGIDVSYTLNFKRRLEEWEDTWFVNERPMLIMSIGTARVYREDLKQHGLYKGDLRPEYERIVKWH